MKPLLSGAEHHVIIVNICCNKKRQTNIFITQDFLVLSFNGRRNFYVQQAQIFTKLLITLCYREKEKNRNREYCVGTALHSRPTAHHPANREVELPTLSVHIQRYHV